MTAADARADRDADLSVAAGESQALASAEPFVVAADEHLIVLERSFCI
jgi:hypothetical protein